MNFIATIAIILLFICSASASDWKSAEFIAAADASQPILIPSNFFVSKYGKGKYRFEGVNGLGKDDCIYLFFEQESTMQKSDDTEWKIVEDSSFPVGTILFERIMKNPFEPANSVDAATLRLRVIGKIKSELARLKSIADEIVNQ